jgi:hypothetical protein
MRRDKGGVNLTLARELPYTPTERLGGAKGEVMHSRLICKWWPHNVRSRDRVGLIIPKPAA